MLILDVCSRWHYYSLIKGNRYLWYTSRSTLEWYLKVAHSPTSYSCSQTIFDHNPIMQQGSDKLQPLIKDLKNLLTLGIDRRRKNFGMGWVIPLSGFRRENDSQSILILLLCPGDNQTQYFFLVDLIQRFSGNAFSSEKFTICRSRLDLGWGCFTSRTDELLTSMRWTITLASSITVTDMQVLQVDSSSPTFLAHAKSFMRFSRYFHDCDGLAAPDTTSWSAGLSLWHCIGPSPSSSRAVLQLPIQHLRSLSWTQKFCYFTN